MISRVAPFAAYLGFLALAQGLQWLSAGSPGIRSWATDADLWLYPVKVAVVLGLLAYFWSYYEELTLRGKARIQDGLLAVAVGLGVYMAWVRMDWPWALHGRNEGYNPYRVGPELGHTMAGIRLFGAAVVVPIMEELFWRSFLLRYLISPRFESVKLGTFTLFSFVVSVALFGVEHDLWLAGMMAGAAYSILVYRTGQLWPSILAHGVTNFALGLHVLMTEDWRWW